MLIKIDSKFIEGVEYDEMTKHLTVMIKQKFYQHYEVPLEVYESLLRAPSKGTYYNKNIKGKYA